MQIQNENGSFHIDELCGYVGADRPELVREAFDLWGDELSEFRIVGDSGPLPTHVHLFDYTRRLLGKDTPNYAQQVGDCCSFGAKNAVEYVQALPILNGTRLTFKSIFPPYSYGTGRVQVGGKRIGLGDGSTGIWTATAATKFGLIPTDMPGCPEYSGSLARQWGRGSGPPQQFLDEGKQHLIKSTALVKSLDDVVAALANGYPVTVASNQGFSMSPGADGFHKASGTWNHQMCIIAYGLEEGGIPAYFGILNSWSDVMGKLKDFRDPSITWPVGMIRARPEVVARMIGQGDSFAWSLYDGYPAQPLPRSDFDLWS